MSGLRFVPETAEPGALSSDATIVGDALFTTVIPTNESGALVGSSIEEQSEAAILAIKRVLEASGSSLARVAHLTIYLTDILQDRPGFNQVYARHFPVQPPVRCAVGVASLARPGMLVELTAIASVAG